MAECKKCIHEVVCESAKACDGRVPGCEHFKEGWISVKDRLPKEAGWYIAYGDSKYANMRFTRTLCWNGRWWSDVMGAGFCVTHWMPLPQPPKGE
jgi:hypothetical protein